MLIEQKSLLLYINLAFEIANSVFNKGKSAVPSLFNDLVVLSSPSDKQIFLLKTHLGTLILMTQMISLPVFPSRTDLKMQYISVTLKLVEMFISKLDLSKESGPGCIPVVVLKRCELELS